MSVRYLTLDDFVEIAELVTGLDAETIRRSSRLELADSADWLREHIVEAG